MQHNEEMGVVAFFWPFAAAALSFSACVKSVDIKYLCSDWPLKAGLILVRGLRGPHWCCYAEIQAWNPVVMSGTTMSETAGWLQVQWSIFQKHLKLRRSAISGRIWSRSSFKNMDVYTAGLERNIMQLWCIIHAGSFFICTNDRSLCWEYTHSEFRSEVFLWICLWVQHPKMRWALQPATRGQTRAPSVNPCLQSLLF